jgi:DNA-binding MarR family transcriptional regulator
MNNPEDYAEDLLEYLAILKKEPFRMASEILEGETAVLRYLAEEKEDGTATPTELSRYFVLSTARVANMLNGLEEKKLAERIPDTADKRKTNVRITEQGRNLFLQKKREAVRGLKQLLKEMGEKDADDFIKGIRKARKAIRKREKKTEA